MLEINGLEGITAVLASNDETAVGAMRAIQESGRGVPEHMSIVGFDDISIAQWVYPALTTVRQPFLKSVTRRRPACSIKFTAGRMRRAQVIY